MKIQAQKHTKWYKGKDLQEYHPSGEPTPWLLETLPGGEGL